MTGHNDILEVGVRLWVGLQIEGRLLQECFMDAFENPKNLVKDNLY